ncbi:MAG TPA: hypothetical protein VM888_11360, partial [Chitinophagaceae bacterium]|nr:hypothetical protein [Chitinophagaceae bacterium]
MKKILTAFCLLFILNGLSAQDFPGYRAGNYTGVNGVFFNPASIADSRYRFDVNLFSISTMVGNNKASYRFSVLTKSFNADSLENKVFGKNAGPSTGIISVAAQGPAVLFNAGKRSAVALTSRVRTITNIIDIDGQLADKLINDLNTNFTYPYIISSTQKMQVAVNAWTELGASFATILQDKGPHFVKGGI